jgi:hypothetical protein
VEGTLSEPLNLVSSQLKNIGEFMSDLVLAALLVTAGNVSSVWDSQASQAREQAPFVEQIVWIPWTTASTTEAAESTPSLYEHTLQASPPDKYTLINRNLLSLQALSGVPEALALQGPRAGSVIPEGKL